MASGAPEGCAPRRLPRIVEEVHCRPALRMVPTVECDPRAVAVTFAISEAFSRREQIRIGADLTSNDKEVIPKKKAKRGIQKANIVVDGQNEPQKEVQNIRRWRHWGRHCSVVAGRPAQWSAAAPGGSRPTVRGPPEGPKGAVGPLKAWRLQCFHWLLPEEGCGLWEGGGMVVPTPRQLAQAKLAGANFWVEAIT